MRPTARIRDDEYEVDTVFDAFEAVLQKLELSEEKEAHVRAYLQFAMKPHLSESAWAFIEKVWAWAQDDEALEMALSHVDDIIPPYLEGKELVADDGNLQAYITEHWKFLVSERLRQHSDEQKETLSSEQAHLTLFCPDGSAIVRLSMGADSQLLDESTICSRCQQPYADHAKVYGGIPSAVENNGRTVSRNRH